jgi:hypothetical protein
MVGEQKDPISFLCSLEKKVAVRNKLNPRTRGWQLQLQCRKRKRNGLRGAEYLILASNSSNSAQSKIKSKLSDLNTICSSEPEW